MSQLVRYGISMEEDLAVQFDELVRRRNYGNRSEAVRDLVRQELIRQDWQTQSGQAVGTITLVYDHHVRQIESRMVGMQHEHHEMVVSMMHVHLTPRYCLEVIVLRGAADEIRSLADRLIAARGVLHGELVATTTGELFSGQHNHGHNHRPDDESSHGH
jgi:CopG family transcriptional regulator, nickel-responsive regulator